MDVATSRTVRDARVQLLMLLLLTLKAPAFFQLLSIRNRVVHEALTWLRRAGFGALREIMNVDVQIAVGETAQVGHLGKSNCG